MSFKSEGFLFSNNVSIKHYLGLSRIVQPPFLTKFSPLKLPSSKCERGKELLNSVRRETDACQNQGFLLFPQCFHRGFCIA